MLTEVPLHLPKRAGFQDYLARKELVQVLYHLTVDCRLPMVQAAARMELHWDYEEAQHLHMVLHLAVEVVLVVDLLVAMVLEEVAAVMDQV